MVNVAIDGFTGCGKTTLTKALCEKTGFKMLDTGAIFRGIACAFVDGGLEEMNDEVVDRFVQDLKVEAKFIDDKQHVFVNGVDQTANLRTEKISQMASKISAFAKVREFMVKISRDFASKNDCIVEGRDIGSVVLPNAQVKIFLTADEKVRAQRRLDQLHQMGKEAIFDDVLKDLQERDYRDSHREVAPLKKVDDAVLVDNTNMSFEETINHCLNIISEKTK